MTDWPRPPRAVPRRVALATWSAFGRTMSLLLLVASVGPIVYWADDDFRSPRIDQVLDAGVGREVAMGEILTVARDRKKHGDPGPLATYTFRFQDRTGRTVEARCSGGAQIAPGTHHGVEYRADDPTAARLVGMHHSRLSLMLEWYPGYVLLPLLLGTGVWLARSYRTYVLARHGRAADAMLLEFTERRPWTRRGRPHCRVRYRFRGSDGSDHDAWQHERPDTRLARLCAAAPIGQPLVGAFVVHSELSPQRCRLVAADEVTEANA